MIDHVQLRALIIRPVLKSMFLYSESAEELLIGTCAQESKGGTYLIQKILNETPEHTLEKRKCALGIYQMEPNTHDDIWRTYLPAHPKVANDLMQACMFSKKPVAEMMIYNLYYATAMARIFYLRIQEKIPLTLDLQAIYYKTFWNTSLGRATAEDYVKSYNNYVGKKGDKHEKPK